MIRAPSAWKRAARGTHLDPPWLFYDCFEVSIFCCDSDSMQFCCFCRQTCGIWGSDMVTFVSLNEEACLERVQRGGSDFAKCVRGHQRCTVSCCVSFSSFRMFLHRQSFISSRQASSRLQASSRSKSCGRGATLESIVCWTALGRACSACR